MSEIEARGKAARARAHMAAYGEATDTVRAELIASWLATEMLEVEKREAIWRSLKSLDVVFEAMQNAISSGSVLDHRVAVKHILGGNPG